MRRSRLARQDADPTIAQGSCRDALVWSSLGPANEALALGPLLRVAEHRAAARRAVYGRMAARPLPPQGSREYRWVTENRESYRQETAAAECVAARLAARWDTLVGQVREVAPLVAEAVEAAVRGTA